MTAGLASGKIHPSATLSLLLVCNHRMKKLADKEAWKATEQVNEVDIQCKRAAAS